MQSTNISEIKLSESKRSRRDSQWDWLISRSPSLCIDIYHRNYCFGRYLGHRAHAPLDFVVIRFRTRMTHQSLPSNERGVSTENLSLSPPILSQGFLLISCQCFTQKRCLWRQFSSSIINNNTCARDIASGFQFSKYFLRFVRHRNVRLWIDFGVNLIVTIYVKLS